MDGTTCSSGRYSEQLFNTASNTHGSSTQDTQMSDVSSYVAADDVFHPDDWNEASEELINLPADSSALGIPEYNHGTRDRVNARADMRETSAELRDDYKVNAELQHIVDVLGALNLSDAQGETLQRYCQRWNGEQHFPTNIQLESIANLEDLPVEGVRAWFECFLEPTVTSGPPPAPVVPATPAVGPIDWQADDAILQEVRNYARSRFWHSCYTRQARRSSANLPFKCTSDDCEYSTDERDAWQRHEQSWQPQDFWRCVLCRATERKSFICTRKDKFLIHLAQSHKSVDAGQYEDLRQSSKIGLEAGYETHCKFYSCSGECGYRFRSWEDRIRHYIQHFREKVPDGPWQLRYSRNRWFDDDNDGPGSSSSTGPSNGNPPYVARNASISNVTNPTRSGSDRSNSTNQSTSVCDALKLAPRLCPPPGNLRSPRTIASAECSTSRGSRPYLLIDVNRESLVKPPTDAKYLALDHTWADTQDANNATISIVTSAAQHLHQQDIQHLPMPFEKAVAFARDIGYRYLWIAELCEPHSRNSSLRAIFEQAALTIVPLNPTTSRHQVTHFTCDYKNVQQVSSWAHQIFSLLHIQNLGHGAYGIVDEVKIRSTQESFARKEVFEVRGRRKVRVLQEIEIMQKLNHPHIARFVAAYYENERHSLNILMTPVAQCNLRQYLADPGRWPDKRDDLPRWFISLASALEYMHSLSCRHKDIKPANILIYGRDVLLSDFGTSHDFSMEDNSESYGGGLMTPKYSAPEVAMKQTRGRKADIFSLGCVYIEMITVELGSTLEEMHAHLGVRDCSVEQLATYHARIAHLTQWLDRLKRLAHCPRQRRLIGLCGFMISLQPSKRPSASAVYDILCTEIEGQPRPDRDRCSCCDHQRGNAFYRYLRQTEALSLLWATQSTQKSPTTTLTTSTKPTSLTSAHLVGGLSARLDSIEAFPSARRLWMRRSWTIQELMMQPTTVNSKAARCSFATEGARFTYGAIFPTALLLQASSTNVTQVVIMLLDLGTVSHGNKVLTAAPRRSYEAKRIAAYARCSGPTAFPSSFHAIAQHGRSDRRKVYRRAMHVIRLVLSVNSFQSKSTDLSLPPDGIDTSTTQTLRTMTLSMMSTIVDPDLLLFLVYLASYNIGCGSTHHICFSAIVSTLTTVTYSPTSDEWNRLPACSGGDAPSACSVDFTSNSTSVEPLTTTASLTSLPPEVGRDTVARTHNSGLKYPIHGGDCIARNDSEERQRECGLQEAQGDQLQQSVPITGVAETRD